MSDDSPKYFGLAANGHEGEFYIEVDEAVDGPEESWMTIERPGWSFCFRQSEFKTSVRILSFLREQTGRLGFSEIEVGSFQGAPVRLVKDDEYGDRFFLKVFGDRQLVEFTLGAKGLTEFTAAIAQVVQDLEN